MINSIKFGGYSPNRNYDLTRIDGLPCAYCGRKMFFVGNFDKKLDKAKTEDEYIACGKEYEEYLDVNELPKLNKDYLKDYPKGIKFAVRNLFMPHISTKDHIIPKSSNGISDIENYITVCYMCNSNKKSISLLQLLNSNNSIAENIQNHLDYLKEKLPELIRNRKISPKYRNYPEIIAKNLEKISNGTLKIIL